MAQPIVVLSEDSQQSRCQSDLSVAQQQLEQARQTSASLKAEIDRREAEAATLSDERRAKKRLVRSLKAQVRTGKDDRNTRLAPRAHDAKRRELATERARLARLTQQIGSNKAAIRSIRAQQHILSKDIRLLRRAAQNKAKACKRLTD